MIISQKFEEIQRKGKEVDVIRDNLSHQIEIVEKKKEELAKAHMQQVEQLEAISGLSADDARQQLVVSLRCQGSGHVLHQ